MNHHLATSYYIKLVFRGYVASTQKTVDTYVMHEADDTTVVQNVDGIL